MSDNSPTHQDVDRIKAVKQAHQNELMSMPNVVGVGLGYQQKAGEPTDTLALIVMVNYKIPKSMLAPADVIPSEIDGVPVDVQEVGNFRAQ
jgi:hypothetical protein